MAATLSPVANGNSAVATYKIERIPQAEAMYALPIRVAQSCAMIEGRQTHVVSQNFADRILVIVTQVGKVGALTQLTTHKRPTLPRMYDDDFLNDEADNVNATSGQIGTDTNDSTSFQPLFGTTPIGQEILYDFYKQQISALIQSEVAKLQGAGFESKPVIVGMSLALPSTQTDVEDDDEGDFAEVANTERQRFEAILNLVRQARTW